MEGEEGPYLFAPYIEKRGGSPTNYGGERRVADERRPTIGNDRSDRNPSPISR